MKILTVIFSLFIGANVFGQSQTELNYNAKSEYEKVDQRLNQTYQKIIKEYKDDILFIKNLKEAQRQWIKFRDAQLNMKYPGSPNLYGSVLPMCKYYYLEELTKSRVEELRQWLEGIEEGDVCIGSVKIKK